MTAFKLPVNPKSANTPSTAGIRTHSTAPTIPSFDTLPDSAYIREAQLVQSPKHPDRPAPLPFSAPTLWRKVKAGTFVAPYRLSARVTAWKVGEVRAWMAAQAKA